MQVIDFHCDTLSALRDAASRGEELDFGRSSLSIDLEKLHRGDYMMQCFALYTDFGAPESPLVSALEQVDQFQKLLAAYPDEIAQVRTWADLQRNRAEGKISAMLTVEEGACCLGSTAILRVLYSLGVRIMTLTWNYENELAFPNCVQNNTVEDINGLKEKGFEFLAEMERLGILVDVSHLGDAGFWDVFRNTKNPFIASHSNARTVCGHVRNLTDDMIRAIADRGGITGLNYCPLFLDPGENPKSTVAWMAKHAAYLKKVGGIDCIGLGSDFDGIDGDLEMYDASCLPMLEAELRRQHFTDDEIEKIYYGNALRVLQEVLPEE